MIASLNSRKYFVYVYIFLLLFAIVIQGQEYDEAFMQSLPPEVRDQVIKEMQESDKSQEKQFRRPSTEIRKTDLNTNRFGIELFNSMQTTFMPLNEPNFDGSYILDFGDVLEIQFIGLKSDIFEADVKADGSINIKDIGKLYLAGLTLDKADDLIRSKVSELFTGTKVFTSLTSTRDIQVYILGEALNPGLYTLSGNSNLLSALSMAGGIKESGSLRMVDHKRGKKTIATLDLYNVFNKGEIANQNRLRSGDVIFVNPVGDIVSSLGGVNRPMEYELVSGETFIDLINYSNGYLQITPNRSYRVIDGINGSYKDLGLDQLDNTKPRDQDSLFISFVESKSVKISGAVNFPGTYQIPSNTTISEFIEMVGGYKETAYLFGGILLNKKKGEISLTANNMFEDKFIKSLIKNNIEFAESIQPFLKGISSRVNERLIAEFDLDVIKQNPSLDIILDDLDEIVIPYITQQVYVHGAVNSPGSILYKPGLQVQDYITLKGGVTEIASSQQIFIISPNGDSKLVSKSRLFADSTEDLVYPGSLIFISPDISLSATQNIAVWAPLISSISLTLASLQVLR
jgi:protein involved in polysaccharide export with SLBB domain